MGFHLLQEGMLVGVGWMGGGKWRWQDLERHFDANLAPHVYDANISYEYLIMDMYVHVNTV